jgi:predicted metal-binding membrane protein
MPIDNLLKRDRWFVLSGLAGVSLLSWFYLARMAQEMSGSASTCLMPMSASWAVGDFFTTFLMWAIMMVAMMIPSAAPMVLTFTAVNRKRSAIDTVFVPTWIFVAGYLLIWTVFSLLATLLQWGLHAASLLTPMTLTVGPLLGGGLLMAAGIYQWTPLKKSCLTKCVAPLDFLLTEWREGASGAMVMGIRHGMFCTGCCAMIMVLLFVAGVMNLLWVAVLAMVVLIEKLVPANRFASSGVGFLLVSSGVVLWCAHLFSSSQ